MKHLKSISRTPSRAQNLTPGQILSFIAEILAVVAETILAKETVYK